MRIPASALLAAAACHALPACGRSPASMAPEESLGTILEQLHPAAVIFAERVRTEFEDNDNALNSLRKCKGFPALMSAAHRVAPGFTLQGDDLNSLGSFALDLGYVDQVPEHWQVQMLPDPVSPELKIASIQLQNDLGSDAYFVRMAPDKKKGWRLASWPPLVRWAFQRYPLDAVRFRLLHWEAGAVPELVQFSGRRLFDVEIPAAESFVQVTEWFGRPLYSPADEDPWSKFQGSVMDVRAGLGKSDLEGWPTAPVYLLAEPAFPASLLLGVLETLARPPIRWPSVQLGTSTEAVDLYHPLEQQLAWEQQAGDLILAAGGSESDWTAALAGKATGSPVGLRLDPALPVSAVIADLQRLQAHGFTRVFIALPVKQE